MYIFYYFVGSAVLNLTSNDIDGSIPSVIYAMSSLGTVLRGANLNEYLLPMSNNRFRVATVSLDLSKTGLTGSITGSLGGLDRLSEWEIHALFQCGLAASLFSHYSHALSVSHMFLG